MVEMLQTEANKESIKNSVAIEADANVFFTALDDAKKNQIPDEFWQSDYVSLVQQAFEYEWEKTLNAIKNNLDTEINSTTIDWNNTEDQTVKAYTQALDAFETDLTEYYNQRQQKKDREKGNQNQTDEWGNLKYEFNLVQSIKKLITDKQTAVKKEESNKMNINALLNAPITKESAINFFDNSNPEVYNGAIEQVIGTSTTPIELSSTSTWDAKKLYDRCVAYMGDMSKISGIKLGKPENFEDADRYEWIDRIKRIIEYSQTWKTKTQYIIHGSHDNLQKELANKKADEIFKNISIIDNTPRAKEEVKTDKKTTNWKTETIETRTRVTRLNAFDEKGNYALFNKYLEKKWPEYVKANLTGILQAINVYTPSKGSIDEMDNQLNVFKNGYATTITDYVVAHSGELLESYTNQITENNLNIFGVDQTTRSVNFNKLVKKRNDTGLRQRLPKAKQDELIRIKTKIENFDLPKTKEEAIKKWLDTIIDTFGPMLFNILKFFGIGKATLCKRFPTMTEKINSMFQKEYALSSDEIWVINTISGKYETKPSTLDTAKKIKDAFAEKKDDYIDHFLDAKTWYYKYLNINIIKTWLKAYNKKNDKNTTIDNIITIEKNKDTGKEYIASITDQDLFKASLGNIFDTDDVWSEIHNANREIQSKNKDDATINEHNMKEKDAKRYLIQNNQDIARYLTASLFSTKDLAYVMTENSLHNGSEIQEDTPEQNTNEILTFDETYVNADGKVINDSKMIHDVIKDIDKAPEKLIIVHNWKEIPVTKKTDYVEAGQTITTYVKEDWTRVKIFLNDIIKKVEQTTTTPEKPEDVAAELWLTYNDTKKSYTYKKLDGTDATNTTANIDKATLKTWKETEIKKDLTTINDAQTYVFKNYEYVFLKEDKAPSAYSLLTEDIAKTKDNDYTKIMTQANIKSFLDGIKTENNNASWSYKDKFDFAAGKPAAKALEDITAMTTFKTEKDTDGNIKITGENARGTTLTIILKPNLIDFKKTTA